MLILLLFSCEEKEDHNLDATANTLENGLQLKQPYFSASAEGANPNQAFSEYVQVGDLYFLSGKIGTDPETKKLAPGGVEAETKQTLENIKKVLEANDMSMDNVVKAMVVLDDIEDFGKFNAIYMDYFPNRPARTTFAASGLAIGAKIEIEVVAVKD